MLSHIKRQKVSTAIEWETPEIVNPTEILSALVVKRLVVEQVKFLTRE